MFIRVIFRVEKYLRFAFVFFADIVWQTMNRFIDVLLPLCAIFLVYGLVTAQSSEELQDKMRNIDEHIDFESYSHSFGSRKEFCMSKNNEYLQECESLCDSNVDCEYACWSAWKYGNLVCRLKF